MRPEEVLFRVLVETFCGKKDRVLNRAGLRKGDTPLSATDSRVKTCSREGSDLPVVGKGNVRVKLYHPGACLPAAL